MENNPGLIQRLMGWFYTQRREQIVAFGIGTLVLPYVGFLCALPIRPSINEQTVLDYFGVMEKGLGNLLSNKDLIRRGESKLIRSARLKKQI